MMQDSSQLFPSVGPAARLVDKKQADLDSDPRSGAVSSLSLSSIGQQVWWRWLFGLMVLIAVVVIGRLVFLQVVRGGELRERAEHNRVRVQILPAPRGSILDRNGLSLAENAPNFALLVTPADVPVDEAERAGLFHRLSGLIGLPSEDLSSKILAATTASSEPVTIVDHLTYDQALPLMVETAELNGVVIQSLPTRSYPSGPAAASILGYTGVVSQDDLDQRRELTPQSRVGKTGLEFLYDRQLAGQDGRREIERDVRNQRLEVLRELAPEAGNSLQLSIDLPLQQQLYDALVRSVSQTRGTGGAAVALDPRNGEVLAMVSLPTYDNNWFVSGIHAAEVQKTITDQAKPLLNRAIAGQYPSGSIIKPLIGTAALEEGIVTPRTTILSTGGIQIGVDSFPDWQSGGHGLTDLARAIADSVNTYFYTVGGGHEDRSGLGVDRIVNYLERFGWGARLQIDLPGETFGFLPTASWRKNERPSAWRLGDTYHLAIGQGDIAVTPLQVASAVSVIANGGTLFQPHLVRGVIDSEGNQIRLVEPSELASPNFSPSALAAVREGMRLGVLDGSSRALQSLPVSSAGKTGTAQFGNEGKTHAWHTVFAPYEAPEIVIVVVVEGGGEGHAVALPVSKAGLELYFAPK